MKTSDKLILTTALSSLGILGLVQVTLYAKYRSGDIVTEKELHAEQFNRYEMAAPRYLFVEGMLQVHIIPSDSFYIEVEKRIDIPRKGPMIIVNGTDVSRPVHVAFQDKQDTLTITGNNIQKINRRDNPYVLWNLPRVNIYCRDLKEIRVVNAQIILEGDPALRPSCTRMQVENAILWIGQFDEQEGAPYELRAFYDSLSIRSISSTVRLNDKAEVRALKIDLEGTTELLEGGADIERPYFRYGDSSKVSLTGRTLQRLKQE
jgi:hypothetical protein